MALPLMERLRVPEAEDGPATGEGVMEVAAMTVGMETGLGARAVPIPSHWAAEIASEIATAIETMVGMADETIATQENAATTATTTIHDNDEDIELDFRAHVYGLSIIGYLSFACSSNPSSFSRVSLSAL
jgi:hypothetical protein